MRIGIVAAPQGTVVAVDGGEGWFDFTGAYEACTGERIRKVEELAASDRLGSSFLGDAVHAMRRRMSFEKYWLAGQLRFLLPLRPGKVVGLGRNYAAHAAEHGHEAPEEPVFFCKAPSSCIGTDRPIVLKPLYGRVDHEAELAVVVGRQCREISEEEAPDYIGGYTILNDVTARDMQQEDIKKGYPWCRSKSIDTFCPLGPYIVLPDAMPWPVEVDIELRVNDEVRQKGNTSNLLFSIPKVMSHISAYMTLEPGDVIATGTPAGVSPITPGDTVDIHIPEIGSLRNRVVEERRRRYGIPRSDVQSDQSGPSQRRE